MFSKVIDSDRHVAEPITLWQNYLPEAYAEYLPQYEYHNETLDLARRAVVHGPQAAIPVIPDTVVQGKPIQHKVSEKFTIEASKKVPELLSEFEKAATAQGQLASMDEMGIQQSIIFPTDAVYLVNHKDFPTDVSRAFASAYNHWLKDMVEQSPDRLIPLGVISRHDPEQMVADVMELHRWGWKNILLRPEPIHGHSLGSPAYAAFWKACEELEISVTFKGGSHLHGVTVGLDRFESHFAIHACSHYMEAQLAFLSLLEGGVLEDYPTLRFAFMEAGAAWLPGWLWRLDNVCYDILPGELAGKVNMKPSEYFKRQCWIAFEMDEPSLREVVDWVGLDKLLWGTDFPHMDHEFVKVSEIESDVFSPEELNQILEENPKGFFRL